MIYKVWYQSMTAFYGPKVIEADSPEEAKQKFNARGAFLPHEVGLISAKEITLREAMAMSATRGDSDE